jgi:hypothetical protein
MTRESIVKDSPITNGSGAEDNRPPLSGECAAASAADFPEPLSRAVLPGAQAMSKNPAKMTTLSLTSMS